jgi:hypothetical protein
MTLANISASAGKPCSGCSKFSTYIDYNAHGIPIAAQSRQGHTSSFLKHSYVCSTYSAPSATLALSPPPPPLFPLTFAALSPLQPCSSPAPLLPAWRRWRGRGYWHADIFPTNLKTVDVDPSTSSPATTTSRPPQATSRRGSSPSDHLKNNYFIRDKG